MTHRCIRRRLSPLHTALATLATLAAVPAAAQADQVRIASAVDAVTVYPTGASVHRAGRAEVPAGDHQIVFGPLPAALTDDSLRVGGLGQGAVVQGVTVRTARMAEFIGAQVEQLAAEVAALGGDLARLREEHAALVRQRDAMRQQRAPFASVSRAARAAAELERRVAAQSARYTERAAQLTQLRADAERGVKVATVDVTTAREGELALWLAYQVPHGVAWAPAYAAHLDEAGAHVALDLFAAVQQSTGEDWNGVRMTVSTVVPAQGLTLPRLSELAVALEPADESADRGLDGIEMNLRVRGRRAMSAAPSVAGAASAAMSAPSPPPPPTPVEHARGRARANLLAARIEVPGPVTLRSGAPARRVLAAHHDYDVTLEHHAVPRASSSVFMTTRFANAATFPLLAGSVALFLGDEYVGTAQMPATNVGDELALPFGVDARVTVERSLADRRVAQRGGRDETTLRYEYRVANHRDRPVTLTVLDQTPVARSPGLTVRTAALTLRPGARQGEDVPGVMRWRVAAAAGGTQRWAMGYTVSAPHGRALSGEIE